MIAVPVTLTATMVAMPTTQNSTARIFMQTESTRIIA